LELHEIHPHLHHSLTSNRSQLTTHTLDSSHFICTIRTQNKKYKKDLPVFSSFFFSRTNTDISITPQMLGHWTDPDTDRMVIELEYQPSTCKYPNSMARLRQYI
jgi:hypothetical protein